MYRMHIARISSRMLVSASPPKQSFLLFCWPAREMGALPQPCRLALRVTAKQLLAAPILALRDITRYLVSRIPRGFSAVFPRTVPESEDRCGFDPRSDRVA